MQKKMRREKWATKIGIILAVAGSAVGLGNFLRFPGMVALNGGGAFIIPYFISFLLLGIPLCWIEWTLGRYGGRFSHGSGPGIFNRLWDNPLSKYIGTIGIFGPLVIFFYYVYIESWTLAYAFFSLTGKFSGIEAPEAMRSFLLGFQGVEKNQFFSSIFIAYLFFIITFFANFYIIYKGITKGIERFCSIAMPILAIVGIFLVVWVFTLPYQVNKEWNVLTGLGFLWNPDFKMLLDPKVWLNAAGQIFFTLSVGIGVILTYASYLDRKKDIVLSSLTSASANEFFEVVIGGSFIITAAYIFFGPDIRAIAKKGIFDVGFVTMPLIFQKISYGYLIGFLWFILLFFAGITSSISILQPAISFLEDEFKFSKRKSIILTGIICFIFSQPAIFFLSKGVLSELDFWGGTFALAVFATFQTIIFSWIFGIEKSWKELHASADIRIPGFYKFIMKYITPSFLIIILGYWFLKDGIPLLLLKDISKENLPYILGIRLLLLLFFISLLILVRIAFRKRGGKL